MAGAMLSTLFLFPTEGEAAGLRARRPDAVVGVAGVGMAAAGAGAARLIRDLRPRRVVLCGIAGTWNGALPAGTVVEVVGDVVAALPVAYRREYLSPARTSLPAARAVTVNAVGEGAHYADACCGTDMSPLPVVEQMEGAAVAAVCEALGVEYVHIRAVSNRVGDARGAWRVAEAVEALGAAAAELCEPKAAEP